MKALRASKNVLNALAGVLGVTWSVPPSVAAIDSPALQQPCTLVAFASDQPGLEAKALRGHDSMSTEEWNRYTLQAGLEISLPSSMKHVHTQAIDSYFYQWKNENISVSLDISPFADPLTSYLRKEDVETFSEKIGGKIANVISFQKEDGSHFFGAHFPNVASAKDKSIQKLTLFIESRLPEDSDVPMKIVRSLTFADQ
jgi:hypothetical protein